MKMARQGVSFVLIGGSLVLVDWATFVLLSSLGVAPLVANVAGRVAGALLGFWANGQITFKNADSAPLGARHFARFATSWMLVTLLSTYLVTVVADQLGLRMAWLAKPVVEGALAMLSFFVSRHWVYR